MFSVEYEEEREPWSMDGVCVDFQRLSPRSCVDPRSPSFPHFVNRSPGVAVNKDSCVLNSEPVHESVQSRCDSH